MSDNSPAAIPSAPCQLLDLGTPFLSIALKTVPSSTNRNKCANAAGKTLTAHLTGRCRRWDGRTMIEVAR